MRGRFLIPASAALSVYLIVTGIPVAAVLAGRPAQAEVLSPAREGIGDRPAGWWSVDWLMVGFIGFLLTVLGLVVVVYYRVRYRGAEDVLEGEEGAGRHRADRVERV